MKRKVKTILFDVSGVLGDVRGTVSWKIKVAMEEAQLDKKYGIGFIELAKAYSSGGFDRIWEKYRVDEKVKNQYFRIWSALQEYPPGSVRIYPEAPFVLNKLLDAGITICFLTRLTSSNVLNVLKELQRRGFKGKLDDVMEKEDEIIFGSGMDIKIFNPKTLGERIHDKEFVGKVMYRAIEKTMGPRAYVGDEIDRGPYLAMLDEELLLIGSTRGFFSVEDLKTVYYKKLDDYFDFKNFKDTSDAMREGYRKEFDAVIEDLKDLYEIIDVGGENNDQR